MNCDRRRVLFHQEKRRVLLWSKRDNQSPLFTWCYGEKFKRKWKTYDLWVHECRKLLTIRWPVWSFAFIYSNIINTKVVLRYAHIFTSKPQFLFHFILAEGYRLLLTAIADIQVGEPAGQNIVVISKRG